MTKLDIKCVVKSKENPHHNLDQKWGSKGWVNTKCKTKFFPKTCWHPPPSLAAGSGEDINIPYFLCH